MSHRFCIKSQRPGPVRVKIVLSQVVHYLPLYFICYNLRVGLSRDSPVVVRERPKKELRCVFVVVLRGICRPLRVDVFMRWLRGCDVSAMIDLSLRLQNKISQSSTDLKFGFFISLLDNLTTLFIFSLSFDLMLPPHALIQKVKRLTIQDS